MRRLGLKLYGIWFGSDWLRAMEWLNVKLVNYWNLHRPVKDSIQLVPRSSVDESWGYLGFNSRGLALDIIPTENNLPIDLVCRGVATEDAPLLVSILLPMKLQ